jgi:hypothetical protein
MAIGIHHVRSAMFITKSQPILSSYASFLFLFLEESLSLRSGEEKFSVGRTSNNPFPSDDTRSNVGIWCFMEGNQCPKSGVEAFNVDAQRLVDRHLPIDKRFSICCSFFSDVRIKLCSRSLISEYLVRRIQVNN